VVHLDESTTTFSLKLTSTSSDVVRYRVSVQAPYVAIAEKRGEFQGETSLEFSVDSSKMSGRESTGTIKIFTTLGERVVEVPIRAGLTGKYQGALRYETNGVTLGDARVAVELREHGADIDALLDPESSLLFPETNYGKTTGFGARTVDEDVELTVVQRIDKGLGGERNHFERDIARRITFKLKKNERGDLEGTFLERIYGLFEQPIELVGSVSLYYRSGETEPSFELSPDTKLPVFESPPQSFAAVFGDNGYADCDEVLAKVAGEKWADDRRGALAALQGHYALDAAMENRVLEGLTYDDLVEDCEGELRRSPMPDAEDVKCAWLPALACGAHEAMGSSKDSALPEQFNELMTMTVAPSLLIAQQHVVDALDASFKPGGLSNERRAYELASESLDGVARWVLHPSFLEYMRSMSAESAQGAAPAEGAQGTELESYAAGRALARVLTVLGTIDGERSRIAGIDVPASSEAMVRAAQERALIGLLEAATLAEITRGWGITPDVIAADLSGLLNPLDSGFGALLEGARAFGVPEGFIPFVWRPEDAGQGATNFEQMLALAGKTTLGEKVLEEAYLQNARSFEQSESQLLQETQNLMATYESQIAELCGTSFELSEVKADADWERCGADKQGEVGLGLLGVEMADARIESSHSRLLGMQDKIAIDQDTLARKQGVRASTLSFVESTGRQLSANTMAQGIIDTVQSSLQVAANSQVMNFGAPAAMATVNAVLGVQRTLLQVQRQELETAQTMRFQKQDASLELLDGMANIQRQVIDLNQLGVDMIQDDIAKQEAIVRVENDVERAKRLFALRAQAVVISGKDPSHDPSYRLLRDGQALKLIETRARAQRMLYLAARALEYEVNTPIESLGSAVLAARSSLGMTQLEGCLNEIHTSYRVAFGSPQGYKTELSVRELLGITGPRTDDVTGEELSPGQQFRLYTQNNQAYSADGALTITFSTNLQPGNGLWSTDVCGDRVAAVRAQLVGDNLGDSEAQVNVSLTGAAFVRSCDSESVQTWSMAEGTSAGTSVAVLQAGVNSFGSAEPNHSLFGQSVARSTWQLTIPPGTLAPSNLDLDLSELEDIVLEVEHEASPRRSTPLYVDTSCLMSVD
jgi:hypothetical protein